jgi:GNAT superfamily N-acetyltransferase
METLRRLTISDIDRIRTLHATAGRDLPPGFIRRKTDAQMCGYLDGTNGVAYGILDGGMLAAMGLLRIPTGASRAGGPPFPLVPPEDWPFHACFLEHTMVHPRARGRGLQRTLLDARLRYAAGTTMRWTCGGVRLLNVASWKNLLSAGMVIAGIRRDPGYAVIGLLRAVDGRPLTAHAGDELAVAIDDVAGHERALADGRVGARIAVDGTVRYRPYGPAIVTASAASA